METRLSNILKITNATKFIKTILESTFKVVLGTFVKGCWVLSTFWHLDCDNFCYILIKTAKLYFLEASLRSLKTTHHKLRYFNFFRNFFFQTSQISFFISNIILSTFFLIELHNFSKGQLADRILKLWKCCVYDYRVLKHRFFEILKF